jgi:hypothetical protein
MMERLELRPSCLAAVAAAAVIIGCAGSAEYVSVDDHRTYGGHVSELWRDPRCVVPFQQGAAKAAIAQFYSSRVHEEYRVRGVDVLALVPARARDRVQDQIHRVDSSRESYRFREFGIWYFFDERDRLDRVRLDPPFGGLFGGIKIGDSRAAVEDHGLPWRKYPFGEDEALVYRDGATGITIRYDVAANGRVVRVFLIHLWPAMQSQQGCWATNAR